MKEKIIEFIKKYNLIEKNDSIIIGFSGGPDSVFLVHILCMLKKEYNLKLVAVHINHLIREESYIDEEFSRKMAEELNVDFKVYKVNVKEYAKKNKLSLEDAGRKVRYETFQREADLISPNAKIAVAHHKDDLAETVLMNLFRGSGSNGLIGIKEINGNIIRPMLSVTKAEIVKYLDDNNIDYVIDKTNEENDYRRNQIRNEFIPYIKENSNENIIESLSNMSNIIKEEQEFINGYVDKLDVIKELNGGYYICKHSILNESKAIQRNIIFKIYERLNGNRKDLSYKNVETILKLLNKDEGSFEIKNYRVYVHDKKIIFIKRDNGLEYLEKDFLLGEVIEFNSYKISCEVVDNIELKKYSSVAYFNLDILDTKLAFRSRLSGDTVKLEEFSKKLKNDFIDKKIDKYKRDGIPILVSDGNIVWALGVRRSSLYKVTSSMKKVLKISFER